MAAGSGRDPVAARWLLPVPGSPLSKINAGALPHGAAPSQPNCPRSPAPTAARAHRAPPWEHENADERR